MSDTGWATLLEVYDRLEAEIIKEALEAQGIPAEIFQEGAGHFAYPVNVGPLGKVEICVAEERFDEAEAWLQEYQDGNLENAAPADTTEETKEDGNE
ncbi:MAG: hypothetical protein EHM81_02210 [Chloroflexi bacterium]|nr:MAG: hypothetical protein EHM81_02210 [Chloroflexota bacterium]